MKVLTFLILLAALTVAPAGAQFFSGAGPCRSYSACAHNNSKECRDARNAFAEHHNGQYPEQFCNQWYQGQQGRWVQQGNQWQWAGTEGNQWYQGRRGQWFQEHDGWQFHDDKGNQYRKAQNGGWNWSGVQPKVAARETHDKTHQRKK